MIFPASAGCQHLEVRRQACLIFLGLVEEEPKCFIVFRFGQAEEAIIVINDLSNLCRRSRWISDVLVEALH